MVRAGRCTIHTMSPIRTAIAITINTGGHHGLRGTPAPRIFEVLSCWGSTGSLGFVAMLLYAPF